MRFRKLKNNNFGSAIAFIVSMLIVGMVVSALIGTFALQVNNAATDEAIAGGNVSNSSAGDGVGGGDDDFVASGIPGGPAMILVMGMLFIVIPIIIFAKAAS